MWRLAASVLLSMPHASWHHQPPDAQVAAAVGACEQSGELAYLVTISQIDGTLGTEPLKRFVVRMDDEATTMGWAEVLSCALEQAKRS